MIFIPLVFYIKMQFNGNFMVKLRKPTWSSTTLRSQGYQWVILFILLLNPAPPSDDRNKKKYFRGSFQFSIVSIQKNITPLKIWNLII